MTENLTRHLRTLSGDIGSRSILEPDRLEAAALYIESEFESAGLQVVRQEYEAFGVRTGNIVARTPDWQGDGPVLVLGAHYDTVQGTPGADDNASAVAVLIETARKVWGDSPEKSSNLLFVAFSTEEPPCFATEFMGSRIFADSMKESEIEVRGALVLEMVGYFSDEPGSQSMPHGLDLGIPDVGDFIALVADGQSADLAESTQRAFEESGAGMPSHALVVPGSGDILSDLIRLSDNASFWDAGIAALMVTDTAFLRNPNYHQESDTMDTLDVEAMARLVNALAFAMTRENA